MWIRFGKYKEINKAIKYIVYIATIMIMIGLIISCNKQPIEKIVYIPIKDTVADKINNAKIVELNNKYSLLKDSFNNVRDSLNAIKGTLDEDLFVAKYKLGRIKYYTNIVDNKPTQIKFYKGWIKRVLKE